MTRFVASLALCTLVNGILAGINLDRYIVQVPAFRRLPIEQWIDYVRVADLRTGLVWSSRPSVSWAA